MGNESLPVLEAHEDLWGAAASEGQIELISYWECRGAFQAREGPAPIIRD